MRFMANRDSDPSLPNRATRRSLSRNLVKRQMVKLGIRPTRRDRSVELAARRGSIASYSVVELQRRREELMARSWPVVDGKVRLPLTMPVEGAGDDTAATA